MACIFIAFLPKKYAQILAIVAEMNKADHATNDLFPDDSPGQTVIAEVVEVKLNKQFKIRKLKLFFLNAIIVNYT